jgi:CHAT domain-containing protein
LNYLSRPAEAEVLIRRVVATEDPVRHPAVAGRAHWVLGTLTLRRGLFETALAEALAAVDCFTRSHEKSNLGGAYAVVADARFALGDSRGGFSAARQTLEALRSLPLAVQRHNELFTMTKYAAADGFYDGALQIADADVAVAMRTAMPAVRVEALLARARVRAVTGRDVGARADIDSVRRAVASWPAGDARNWFSAHLSEVQGEEITRGDPRQAIVELDSVVAFFAERHNALRLVPALVARAQAKLALGAASAARADLERALSLLDGERLSIHQLAYRVSLLERARELVDRLVTLDVASPGNALASLERGRAALDPARHMRVVRPIRFHMPPGVVGVEYALLGDTLLAWTVVDTAVRLTTIHVDRVRLLHAIEEVQTALELRVGEVQTRVALRSLYDQLVRPVSQLALTVGAPLVIVADGELAAVPFAALQDAATGRYLIEDHPLRFASRLGGIGARAPGPAPDRLSVLAIADTAAGGGTVRDLEPLAGAREEAAAVRRLYPQGELLGAAVTPRVVLGALQHASVVHYAGHAVFDDLHPEQSFLALAGASTPDGGITAADLGHLDLHRLRLVVLSACRTLGARPGHSGGFVGFAGALIGAGAGGVIGSLWRVDDALTLPLMLAFHRTYRSTGDGAASLRAAQLEVLHSGDIAHRSPSAWAGFRYFSE